MVTADHNVRRRRTWFDAGARDLSNVTGQPHDRYACPLCLTLYPETTLTNGELTDEDVPPKSVGGKKLVLTCRACNSVSGHDLDAHLAIAEAHLDLASGPASRPIKGTFTLGAMELIGTLERDGDALVAKGVPKANRPGAPEAMDDEINRAAANSGSRHIGFRSHEGWVQGRARIAWTRAAYLAAFAIMGYAYILQPELEDVRAQIAHPDEDRIPSTVTVGLDADLDARHLLLIEDPTWLKSIAVTMRRRTVFLPVTPDPDFFHRVATQLKSTFGPDPQSFEFRGKRKPWPVGPFGIGEGANAVNAEDV